MVRVSWSGFDLMDICVQNWDMWDAACRASTLAADDNFSYPDLQGCTWLHEYNLSRKVKLAPYPSDQYPSKIGIGHFTPRRLQCYDNIYLKIC